VKLHYIAKSLYTTKNLFLGKFHHPLQLLPTSPSGAHPFMILLVGGPDMGPHVLPEPVRVDIYWYNRIFKSRYDKLWVLLAHNGQNYKFVMSQMYCKTPRFPTIQKIPRKPRQSGRKRTSRKLNHRPKHPNRICDPRTNDSNSPSSWNRSALSTAHFLP
jgi:hypothetical protein